MRSLALGTSILILAGVSVAGCGGSGPSGPAADRAAGCRPVSGNDLVVLVDDKHLQTVDNVVPAIHRPRATPALVKAVDKVSASLTTDRLVALNRQVDIDRKTASSVADGYVRDSGVAEGLSGGSGPIRVGAANFGESKILATIYARALSAAGFDATVREVGNRELYLRSLSSGEIDVMPEYVGTLTEFLNQQQNGSQAATRASGDLNATMGALTELGRGANLVFGLPARAADQNAFAVTRAFAETNGVRTLSDVATRCAGGSLVLGGPTECQQRPFCRSGLTEVYGITFTNFVVLDTGGPLTKTALRQGKIQIGLVFSSDGSLG
ncbi:MAG: glycine/betaine ABC transporter substrate-binding protein [Actinobacteria bacterium]|nr:glycine/betaine ABC transporter substrate-binding protein [Actinomycetota bacterium]MBI3687491.1 glycine/betaine ABC transporter substrate-binding protein [Actinomycetota bacterium]